MSFPPQLPDPTREQVVEKARQLVKHLEEESDEDAFYLVLELSYILYRIELTRSLELVKGIKKVSNAYYGVLLPDVDQEKF